MTAFCDTVTGYISNDAEFVGLLAGHNSPRLTTNSQFVRSNSVTHDRRTGTAHSRNQSGYIPGKATGGGRGDDKAGRQAGQATQHSSKLDTMSKIKK